MKRAAQACGMKLFPAAALGALVLTIGAPLSIAAAGDTYVYRVINAYNNETVGQVRHELTPATTARGQVVTVTVDTPALGLPRTEVLTPQGLWLRRPLDNHGMPIEYEFSAALPAVQPQLGAGQSWSVRVNAKVAGHDKSRSVRVDGRVIGHERIRVPAGEFDTVKIQRTIYAGDAEYFRTETRIVEMDWYAAALGRSVRTESRSGWRDTRSGCLRPEHCDFRGDWHVFELTEARTAIK
jgi:hypothetical protein